MKTFEGIFDYLKFVVLVRNTNRYRFYRWGENFLETLLCTAESRKWPVPKGTFFWRSQWGKAKPKKVDWEEGVYNDTKPYPYDEERMKPRFGMAMEGRANPKGIPYLYLSTDKETAMSECSPWLQAEISVGRFQISRDLLFVDCSRDEYIPITKDYLTKETDPKFVENIIWGQIGNAFAEPVHRSDLMADYSATQVIAEYFKSKNYDGIKYKSAFGDGYNIALFDINAAEMTHCYLFKTEKISYSFEAVEGAHYSTPLGEYLDDPKAVYEFLKRIEEVNMKTKAPDEDSNKT